jgi:hypothetical protein
MVQGTEGEGTLLRLRPTLHHRRLDVVVSEEFVQNGHLFVLVTKLVFVT